MYFPVLVFGGGRRTKENTIPAVKKLQAATATTTLPASRVRGNRSDVLDATDLHTRTGKGSQRRLGARSRGLGAVTACGTELDV